MKKFETYTEWTTSFADQGCFEHLNRLTAFDEWQNWPSNRALQSLFPYEIENLNHKTIRFIAQTPEQDFSAVAYEEIIYQTGNVPTREKSWHDVFGALIWSLFPKTKALINKLHHDDIQTNGKQVRSVLRNALTLFDECGVVLVTKNKDMLEALRQHHWQTSFIQKRELWGKVAADGVLPFIFGHANYEMLTKPYVGLTGKWLAIEMSAELGSLPLNVQYRLVDEKLAELINTGALNDNSNMSPLPLLGVPGWHKDNERPEYYENTRYFRPKT